MSSPDPAKRDVLISKALAYLLRHGALKEKMAIDEDGFVKIDDVLSHNRLKTNKATRADLERIVASNDKQRFSIKGDYICANQGHSIKSVSDSNLTLLNEDTIPDEIFHGTYYNKLEMIYKSGGLRRMTRNHIHFTSNSDKLTNISGVRYNANCLVYVDVRRCMADGIPFYKSANDVVLTPGDAEGKVGCEYFARVVDRKTGKAVDFQK
ncbi:phosphotransferase KptA/Tpt1 [Suhomyces tanzawaensis NRRL Y-17324]|uniref:2'-phosphotransferase n=1 Tax=Suhomyces tanzawaensis NRRL Y-17324 TaxID=984487 RepID=A0A1E4SPM0_9ASCO|nr:phosphotransferase KptA/Tpt1 [Suhomyces tanzawaensis NRRL Y-17324]ODV81474.1 phosphotransferase KptA/Tpt1 [Suhomyces tanzawaensis NRRL Y-17324]